MLWPGSSGSRRTNASPGAGTGRGPWPGSGSWRRGAIRSLTPGGSLRSWWPTTCGFAGCGIGSGTCGLGVPVIGTRCVDPVHPTETDEQFFPRRLRIAATVLAAPGGGLAGGAYRLSSLGLVFHDPFRVGSTWAGGRALPLAADRTTHLALQASQDRLPAQAIRGVIATEFGPEIEPGLYMLRPYAPGKIPLVFVHGLAATPVAFLQAINEFQNDPALSARYQFWVFLYPTGRTIVLSALRLRDGVGPGPGGVRVRPGVPPDGHRRAQPGGHPRPHGRVGLRPGGLGRRLERVA